VAHQTNKQMAASQRQKLRRIQKEIVAMSGDWEDVDEYLRSILGGLASEVEKVIAELATELIPT